MVIDFWYIDGTYALLVLVSGRIYHPTMFISVKIHKITIVKGLYYSNIFSSPLFFGLAITSLSIIINPGLLIVF